MNRRRRRRRYSSRHRLTTIVIYVSAGLDFDVRAVAGLLLGEAIEEVGVAAVCDHRAARNRSSVKAKNHSGKRGSRRPRRRYKDQGSMISVR